MQEVKTPVEIVQELIAALTTRKEAVERILSKNPASETEGKMKEITAQTDQAIAALLGELSQFGDGVGGTVNRENDYQTQWREALQDIDQTSTEDLIGTFNNMEQTLGHLYKSYTAEHNQLPQSLLDILQQQAAALPA